MIKFQEVKAGKNVHFQIMFFPSEHAGVENASVPVCKVGQGILHDEPEDGIAHGPVSWSCSASGVSARDLQATGIGLELAPLRDPDLDVRVGGVDPELEGVRREWQCDRRANEDVSREEVHAVVLELQTGQ